jgi:hypothetical protein
MYGLQPMEDIGMARKRHKAEEIVAIPTSFAGHPKRGAREDPELTFKPDHQLGAGHRVRAGK